jgi:hypothetical protein
MRASANTLNEKCEAQCYLGEWHLLHDNAAEAKASLRLAAESCPKNSNEFAGAVTELKRLAP